jgi:hypothetical protein
MVVKNAIINKAPTVEEELEACGVSVGFATNLFRVQKPLSELGGAFGFDVGCDYEYGRSRRDTESFDLIWSGGSDLDFCGYDGVFADFRIEQGIRLNSLEALTKSKAKYKILVSVSQVRSSLQRRDQALLDFMEEFGIMHVAPFWQNNMKKLAEMKVKGLA